MSVQEIYEVRLEREALEVAERLAAFAGLRLRWAAMWSVGARGLEHRVAQDPPRAEVLGILALEGASRGVVRWESEGVPLVWLGFVDPTGARRADASVHDLELARNAVPLTTLGDGPGHADFALGPEPARGCALRLTVVRDHMPREELVRQLAEAADLLPAAITRVDA